LPDGIFSNPKSQFGKILEGLGIKKVGMFYGLYRGILRILLQFGTFYGHLVI
jgi:hypothetical protein